MDSLLRKPNSVIYSGFPVVWGVDPFCPSIKYAAWHNCTAQAKVPSPIETLMPPSAIICIEDRFTQLYKIFGANSATCAPCAYIENG